MKRLIVLGAGTAGTMAVNKLRHRLSPQDWSITMVDQDDSHHYQPGYLFVPFGGYTPEELVKPRRKFLPDDVDLIVSGIDVVRPRSEVTWPTRSSPNARCATRLRSPTSLRWMVRSPSRWRPSTSAACSKIEASRWRPISWWIASTTRRRPWSRWMSE